MIVYIMSLLSSTKFICLDCETTGLDPKHDAIIEVAVVAFSFDEMYESFETLIDPERPISADSLEIHHIESHMLVGKPKIGTLLPKIFSLIGNSIIIGHSIGFDLELLKHAAEKTKVEYPLHHNTIIDTLRLARLYGDSPNNSLQTLARHFNVTQDEAHRAMADVLTNIAVFKQLTKKFKTLEQLLSTLKSPIKMKYMPLGKYKGRLFEEIPDSYLQWASHMEFDQDLLFSIRSELNKRKKHHSFGKKTNPFLNL